MDLHGPDGPDHPVDYWAMARRLALVVVLGVICAGYAFGACDNPAI